jgi:hypothetical protein
MQGYFADPQVAQVTAFRNSSLQGAYLIVASRATENNENIPKLQPRRFTTMPVSAKRTQRKDVASVQ